MCRQEPEQDPTTSDSLCQICMQQNVEVMLSCGHLLCGKCPSKCANPWLRCPFCRANVYNMMALKNVPPGNVVPLYLGMPPEEPRAYGFQGCSITRMTKHVNQNSLTSTCSCVSFSVTLLQATRREILSD